MVSSVVKPRNAKLFYTLIVLVNKLDESNVKPELYPKAGSPFKTVFFNAIIRDLCLCSPHFIFFVTSEWAKYAIVALQGWKGLPETHTSV